MKLSYKIGLGYFLVALLLVICGVAGFYGIMQLSAAVDYLSGPAWDTDDASMESMIDYQTENAAVHNLLAGIDAESSLETIAQARTEARTHLDKMAATNVLSDAQIAGVEQEWLAHQENLDAFLASYNTYILSRNALDQTATQLVALGATMKEMVEPLMDEYAGAPNLAVAWNDGLEEKWLATDGGMGLQIGMLQQLYYLNELEKSSGNFDATKANITAALALQQEHMPSMVNSGVFDVPAGAQFPNQTIAEVYPSLLNDYEVSLNAYIDDVIAYKAAEATYQDSLNDFLVVLENMEAVTNQTIEAEKANITSVQRLATTVIIVAIIFGVVGASIIGYVVTRSITGAVKIVAAAATRLAQEDLPQLVTAIQTVSAGDLTTTYHLEPRYVELKSKDELGQMAAAFNSMNQELGGVGKNFSEMLINLRELVSQVIEGATQVASASQQLNAASNQAGQASQQVATTIQQIAKGTAEQTQGVTDATMNVEQISRAASGIARGAQEQAQSVQKTSSLVDEMARIVGEVGNVSERVTEASHDAAQTARHGVTTVDQMTDGMDTIRTRTAVAADKIKEMGVRSKEIERIVETIDDIADKTDMLALNAAVEAARAGEYGRGFAVVADQVRKLSEDSKVATRDIAGLIARVQETIDDAVMAMDSAVNEVDNGSHLAGDTANSLQEILQAAEKAATLVEQINGSVTELEQKSEGVVLAIESVGAVVEENTAVAEEMDANSQEVTEAMEAVASVAEENSAATEEVSASAEEMSAQVEEVIASAEELSSLAEQLRFATDQFKVDRTDRDREPADTVDHHTWAVASGNGHRRGGQAYLTAVSDS